jgi:transcriptional regulator with XRE-family HTH domain
MGTRPEKGELERYVGAALRHLRLHGGPEPRKQLDVAAEAGVTRGMLSSYERGRQEPSLRNLDRVLQALGADLTRLHWAIQIVQAAPREETSDGEAWDATPPPPAVIHEPGAVYRAVPLPEPLSADEEEALGELLSGFLAWLRYSRGRRPAGGD